MVENQNELVKKEISQSERFMNKVVSEFSTNVGTVALTDFQKRLAQNYFISLDSVLRSTEEKRMKKSEKYRDPLPVTWANLNMDKLARDVVSMARVGFDPAQPNHINLIPFKNNNTNKYDIGFIEGYRGIELKATKYGLNVPDHVTVELVFNTDKFKPIKKDRTNQHEAYEFEITNPFERGEIIGGFYYHSYTQNPTKNKLVTMSIKDILKRKPTHASVEFWGGEKDKWEDGKKVGKEQVEGWHEQMCWKTIYRAAYSDITIDSQKIDDDYLRLKQMESEFADAELAQEINDNANRKTIDIDLDTPPTNHPVNTDTEPLMSGKADEQPEMNHGQTPSGGPDF